MIVNSKTNIARFGCVIGIAASLLALWALPLLLPPDGQSRTEWLQFIGGFHPLAVHLPIALVLLVPVLELVSRRSNWSYLRPTAGFVLVLAAIAATVAPFIVDAELARTKVTDAGRKSLATFANLRALDLSHTGITSAGLGALTKLKRLETLNLTATEVDDAGIAPFHASKALKHLYLFETKASGQ